MRLTLNSLQTEMRSSFNELSHRIHNLDINVNERIDRILLRLDTHIKETAYQFRVIDERFESNDGRFKSIDERFDEMDRRFDRMEDRLDKLPGELMEYLFPYFDRVEKMLINHDERITHLEKRH